ncbi:MAG: hypothetical protein VX577_02215 [Verrucomicrobiota bacterium]|nr:hypothetical protein [Verrucomicrobiota bacterium]
MRLLDAEFASRICVEESLVIPSNLNCGKSWSQWVKFFVEKLDAMM